jgi:hypothetical protein
MSLTGAMVVVGVMVEQEEEKEEQEEECLPEFDGENDD